MESKIQELLKEENTKLKQENKELLVNKNVAQGIATNLKQENEKLKQAIEILKDKFYLKIHSNMFGSWLFIKEKTKHGEDVSCELDLDIVDTIKEVLNNE